nr:protein ZK1127.8 [imported] - Caenorhabditis elegans [Caenorhabditis elegans]
MKLSRSVIQRSCQVFFSRTRTSAIFSSDSLMSLFFSSSESLMRANPTRFTKLFELLVLLPLLHWISIELHLDQNIDNRRLLLVLENNLVVDRGEDKTSLVSETLALSLKNSEEVLLSLYVLLLAAIVELLSNRFWRSVCTKPSGSIEKYHARSVDDSLELEDLMKILTALQFTKFSRRELHDELNSSICVILFVVDNNRRFLVRALHQSFQNLLFVVLSPLFDWQLSDLNCIVIKHRNFTIACKSTRVDLNNLSAEVLVPWS